MAYDASHYDQALRTAQATLLREGYTQQEADKALCLIADATDALLAEVNAYLIGEWLNSELEVEADPWGGIDAQIDRARQQLSIVALSIVESSGDLRSLQGFILDCSNYAAARKPAEVL